MTASKRKGEPRVSIWYSGPQAMTLLSGLQVKTQSLGGLQ
jgi:hypothetical protein